ncbi:hypothetical protein DFR24_0672 [Panacagrimonas perspica]|uniref:Uncharacterized protein n=1 Tax=Panacagrimonas perspica TaxID=381431 RepID=A0A4R7PBG2_9GAMM|nr:hypothetical protein [Panacagrimonas perspica]TDU31308.1 hypothetical protein DFR24_0672 [Panacagrimonas perspica]THD02649.1 hypothetical protein B1810_13990 [Panacagrimonas perspica]
MSADSAQALSQRRRDFEDAMRALGIPDHHKLALRAAASALAKAYTIDALRTFAQSVKGSAAR